MGKKGAASKPASTPAFDHEKKLRPVYDALEAMNPKGSLKLLTGYITKYGRLPVLLALQALSLQRTGKNEEALELIKELLVQEPTETSVMSPITLVLQAVGKANQITQMYENALKKNPKNQEFMMQIFTCYGREHNFQRQQQIAMQLYTNFKEHKFLFWSAICWLLQGGVGEDVVATQAQTQFLHLAYMMIMRELPKDTPLIAEQCGVVVRLLARQGKVQEAINFVQGPYGKEFYQDDIERRRLLISLHSKLQNWTVVRDIYLDLLTGENPQPSDWHYLCSWIQAEFRVGKADSVDITKTLLPKMEALLMSLQKRELEKPAPQRGSFLASCELYNTLEPSETRSNKLHQSLVGYCELFGTKNCFFDDVRPYLESLDSSCIQAVSQALQTDITNCKQPATRFYLEANLQQITLSFVKTQSVESLEATAKKLFGNYVASLECATGNLEPTERGIGDVFLQMTCSVLLELFETSRNRAYLIDAVLALEHGLERSRFNFQFKLLLVRLYSELGCMRRAFQIYESLSVKQIQLDTMSHFVLHDAVREGYWEEAKKLSSYVLQYHIQYQAEEQDLLARAFRANNFTKVLEFEELRLRLANSHQAIVCGQELRHLDLIMQPDKARGLIRPATPLDINKLSCNEDFSVLLSWHHISKPFWPSVLNRPPPSVLPSSFELPLNEPLTKHTDGYVLGSFYKSSLEVRIAIETQLNAVVEKKVDVLQNSTLPALLEKTGILESKSDNFRCHQWKLGLTCFETARVFAALPITQGQEEDDTNWDQATGSLEGLLSQVVSISKELAKLGPSSARELALFLSYGGLWLTVCLQVWLEQLPKKKGKKAKLSPKLAAVWEKINTLLDATIDCYESAKSVATVSLSVPDVLPVDPSPAAKLSAELEAVEEKKIVVPDVAHTHESLFPIQKSSVNLFFARMQASVRKSFENLNSPIVLTLTLLSQLKTSHK